MKRTIRIYTFFILGFIIYYIFDAAYFSSIQEWGKNTLGSKAIGHIIAYGITIIPLLLSVGIMHNFKDILERIGLKKSILQGLAFALICTLPMFIGFYFKYPFDKNLGWNTIVINTISSAFFEEIIFRGFLFGMLYRYTKLGFLPSIFFSSLLFGLVHLYQSNEFLELLGIFSITFLGSVLFSWIYAEWNFNLWTSIFIHGFMNLFWLIFSAGENALGGVYSNIFRTISIVLIITVTIFYKKKMKMSLEINRKSIWIKK